MRSIVSGAWWIGYSSRGCMTATLTRSLTPRQNSLIRALSSPLEADRQALQRVVEVRALAARLAGQLDRRERVEQLVEEHPALEPGQVDPEAEVLGDAERQVRVRA